MKLSDFRGADCDLFRIPPIDFSYIESALEKTLVRAWQNGSKPSDVIDTLSKDQGVVQAISSQVSASLNFQRDIQLQDLERRTQKQIEVHEAVKGQEFGKIEQNANALLQKERVIRGAYQQEAETRRGAYNATQASLEQMRGRIRESVDKVGGEKNLGYLLSLNDELLGTQSVKNTNAYTGPVHRSYQKQETTIWKKIWRVLNYKIW
jgi:hypothetical protein